MVVNNKKLQKQLDFVLIKKKSETKSRLSQLDSYDECKYATALLANNWKRWDEDPLSFWIQFQGHEPSTFHGPQYDVVSACLQLENEADAHSRILRRFYTVVLHQIRASHSENDDAKTISEVLHSFRRNKSGSQENFNSFVKSMIEAGSRYHNIALRLGLGSLFLLGQGIARTT